MPADAGMYLSGSGLYRSEHMAGQSFSKKRYLYGYHSYGKHHCRRVLPIQEMGKKIELLNREERYNLDLKINEERDNQRLINFIEIYGEDVGKKMFNDDNINRRERESKKRKRKLEKKMNKKK